MVLETVDLTSFISWFEDVGGFDIILPFLLIFTIVFAVMDKIKLFEKKNINVVIAVVCAFFLVVQRDAVLLIQGFLPRVSMIVLTLIMLLLIAGSLGFTELGSGWGGISVIIAIIGVIWALGASVGWDVPALDLFTEQDIAILLIIGVFILVIWFVVREPGQGDQTKKFFTGLNNLFGASKGGSPKGKND